MDVINDLARALRYCKPIRASRDRALSLPQIPTRMRYFTSRVTLSPFSLLKRFLCRIDYGKRTARLLSEACRSVAIDDSAGRARRVKVNAMILCFQTLFPFFLATPTVIFDDP
jgi:hypothetical protein